MNYDDAKQLQVTLSEITKTAYAVLSKFPRSMMGGTTAQFRNTPEYNDAKVAYEQARLSERASNEWFAKTFSTKLKESK